MTIYDPEPRRCDVPRAHRPHDYLRDDTIRTLTRCPGRSANADNLAVLLDRRPELADLTPVTVMNRLGVMSA